MQNLEKILEEIDREIEERRKDPEMRDVDICYGLNRAKEIIRRHMNDGWIPCSESLPEETDGDYYDSVIVTLSDGFVSPGVYRNQDKEWWVEDEGGEKTYRSSDEVIAWKPLPEPYHLKKSNS